MFMFPASPGPIVETSTMAHSTTTTHERPGAGRAAIRRALLDPLQRRVGAHLVESVEVDVGLAVHAR